MYDLLETPDQFFHHVKRVAASIAAIVIFGFRAPTVSSYWMTVGSEHEPLFAIIICLQFSVCIQSCGNSIINQSLNELTLG